MLYTRFGLQSNQSEDWKNLRAVYERIGDFPTGVLSNYSQVVNWAFRGHGHQHLWNWQEFQTQFKSFGFRSFDRMRFGESNILGAAIEKRKNEDFYTIIVEAIK